MDNLNSATCKEVFNKFENIDLNSANSNNSNIMNTKDITYISTSNSCEDKYINSASDNITDSSLKINDIFSKVLDDFYIDRKAYHFGSSSIICKAVNKVTEEICCIKILSFSDQDANKVLNEVNILNGVNHPNIVQIYGYYIDIEKKYIYIVFEWMEGGELFKVINNKELDEESIRDLFLSLVDGVRYCHFKNIVHRDLKSENILFKDYDDDSYVKISDFGVAKFLHNDQKLYSAVGTLSYTAPEIIKSIGCNEKCDVWSLGVILYYLLFKKHPFETGQDNLEQLKDKILNGRYSFPENKDKSINISQEAVDLIKKMLNLDPNIRPSAEEILSDEWALCELSKKNIYKL